MKKRINLMKRQTFSLGTGVMAVLGLGFITGCCTCHKPHEVGAGYGLGASPITVFATPVAGAGKEGTCPGTFSGYVEYTLPVPTWGWTPATNTTTFTAANGGGRTDVRIQYSGEYGDSGCNLTNVTIPNPPSSPAYDFTIYFASNPPTTNYPIILTGFNSTN
ncbi:MAG: hypothetical protein ABSF34_11100 [Verrucomicrobiota bacterium]